MPTGVEIRIQQKRTLYMLKELENQNEGNEVRGLKKLIKSIEAEMDQEDIAFVEKKIKE